MTLTITSTVVWPSTLPLPQRDGYGFTPSMLKAETDVDNGPQLSRQVFSDGPGTTPVVFFLTQAQYPLFLAFWRYGINNGASWFQLTQDSGGQLVVHDCRFVGTYQEQLIGARNRQINANLMVRQIDTPDQSYYPTLLAYGDYDTAEATFQRLDTFSNNNMPTQPGAHS